MAQTISYFDKHKVWNTTRGEYVVYVLSMHWSDGTTCVPNPNNIVAQCAYMQGPEPIWMDTTPDLYTIPSGAQLTALEAEYGPLPAGCTPGTSGPCLENTSYPASGWHMHNMFYPHTDLEVGEWLTYKDNPSGCLGNSNQQCYKVLAVVTEAEWGNQCTECADYYVTQGVTGGPAGSVATCNGVAGGPCYNTLGNGGNPPMGGPRYMTAGAPNCPNGTPLGEGDMLNYVANDCDECSYTWNPPPITYNCELNTQWDPTCDGCYDPGDGTGTFTNATAALAGFANPLLECESSCPCPVYYSCTTSGCTEHNYVLGTNPPAGSYPTSGECQADCVGWGCTVTEELNTDIFVFYDTTSMGTAARILGYNGVEGYLQTLNFIGSVYHFHQGGENWLEWPTRVMTGGSFLEMDAGGQMITPYITLPQRDLTGNTLVINFIDESMSGYYWEDIDYVVTEPGCTTTFEYCANPPTGNFPVGYSQLMTHRTDYINRWNAEIRNYIFI